MKTAECVRCGYCCMVGPCPYGRWDDEKKQCVHLTEENLCAIHDEIVDAESGLAYPMFGSGCSSTLFNTRRENKIKALRERR